MKEKVKQILPWFLLFGVYCVWNYCYPMTSDDLYWRYEVEVSSLNEMWRETLYMGNGRLLGNLGILILVRFPLLKVLYKSVLMVLLPLLLIKLFEIKKDYVKVVCVLLTMFPGNYMFAQIHVWTSGFQNYFLPMVMLVSCLLVIKRSQKKLSPGAGIYLLVCAVAETLFLETATLVMLELAILMFCIKLKNKEKAMGSVVFLAGTIVGACLLFGVPYLLGVSEKMVGYRQVGGGSVYQILNKAIAHIEKFVQTISGCVFLFVILSLVLIFRLERETDKSRTLYHKVASFILISFPCYAFFNVHFIKQWVTSKGWNVYLTIFWFALYMVVLGWSLWKKETEDRKIVMWLLFFALFSYAPMLVISTVRERNCYISYLFLVALVIYLLERVKISDIIMHSLKNGSIIFVVSFVLAISMVCADWHYVGTIRDKYLKRMVSKQETEILLPALPHNQLLQADDSSTYWEYYTDSEFGYDIDIEFAEWYSWLTRKLPAEGE